MEDPDSWYIEKSVNTIALWNHDVAPTTSDGLCRSLEWMELSQEVCHLYMGVWTHINRNEAQSPPADVGTCQVDIYYI